jgi:kynurenine 3-monooxygenase
VPVKRADVVIVGAGPVGTIAGMYFARRGYAVTVYEGRPDPRVVAPPRGRSINLTLSARGWHALRGVGVEDAVREVALPLTGRMIHQRDGSVSRHLYGPKGEAIASIGRDLLTRVLHDAAQSRSKVEIKFGHRLVHLDPASGTLAFEQPNGRRNDWTVRSDRVLAADGASSSARSFLLADHEDDYRHTTLPYYYKEVVVPRGKGGDWSLDPECTHIWPRRELLLCLFPNLDRTFTGSLFMPLLSTGAGWSFASITTRDELRALFEQEFPDLIAANPDLGHAFFSRPTSPIYSIRCSPWTWRGRFALIGDAAHSVTPVLGQGLNSGLEDCSTLDACLDEFSDWAEVLAEYEARRKPNVDALTTLAENHFTELSTHAADPTFTLRKRLENRLQAEFPDQIVPLYSLIAFTRIPYVEAPKIASRQESLISALTKLEAVEERWNSDAVQRLISEYLSDAPLPTAGVTSSEWSRAEPAAVSRGYAR